MQLALSRQKLFNNGRVCTRTVLSRNGESTYLSMYGESIVMETDYKGV